MISDDRRPRPQMIEISEEVGSVEGYAIVSAAEQVENWLLGLTVEADGLIADIRSEHENVAILKNINVDDEHRGHGHGNDLMESFLAAAQDNGADTVLLLCDLNEEQSPGFDLKRWYEGWGFEAVLDTPSGPVMKLEL
jgi:N-acetylglutamate synthase-like GNAT family acetyltransferase